MDSSDKELGPVGVVVLAAATFVVSLGYGALIPVLPGWLMTLQPSSAATIAKQVGELSGIYMLGVFVGALTAGYLSDRIGRRPVLLAGLVVFLAALLATVHVGSLVALYALRFFAGLSGAAVIPVSVALVSAGSLPAKAPSRLAYLGAASLLGFLVGPGIISLPQVLGSDVRWGFSGPSSLLAFAMHTTLGLGIMVLVAALFVRSLKSRASSDTDGRTTTTGDGKFPLFTLLTLNFSILLALGGFEVAISLHGSQRLQLDPLRISLIFAECSVVMLLINGMWFLTPLVRLIAVRTVITFSIGTIIGGFVLLYVSTGFGVLLVAVALIAAGSGIAMPTITYAVASTADRLGAATGQLIAAGSLGQAIGSFVGGWMFALHSSRTFLYGALFMMSALLLGWLGLRGLPASLGPGARLATDPTRKQH